MLHHLKGLKAKERSSNKARDEMIYWGIDNGAGGVKFVKLLVEADGHKVLDFGFYDGVLDSDSRSGSLALANFLTHHTVGKDDGVAISLPAITSISRNMRLPPISVERIPEIMEYEAAQQIPLNMDEITWHYELFPRTDNHPDIEAVIFAMKSELLDQYLAVFEDAGFDAVHVAQATPQTIYNSLQYLGALGDNHVLTVDLGRSSTNLMVVSKESMWSRTVPIGTDAFVNSLVNAFNLSPAKAEALLLDAEDNKYSRQISQAMQPVYVDLVEEIQRSVDFFNSTNRDCPVKDILIFGGNSKIRGLSQHLVTNLGLNPITLTLEEFLDSPEERDAQDPIYWPAFGLALQAAGLSKFKSDFLPDPPSKGQALLGWLSNIKMPAFLRRFTGVEATVILAIIALLVSILVGVMDTLRAQSQTQVVSTPATFETYAVIKIKSLSDGTVDMAAKFYPPLNTELISANPAGHILAQQMLLNSGTHYRVEP